MQATPIKTVAGIKPLELTGGESVYCINNTQMGKARSLVDSAPPGTNLARLRDQTRTELDRNEQAALAFFLIEELRRPVE